jgi:hypothetical protein
MSFGGPIKLSVFEAQRGSDRSTRFLTYVVYKRGLCGPSWGSNRLSNSKQERYGY